MDRKGSMFYDVNTRELSSYAGKLLKKLDCPLHKKWSELTVLSEDDSKRYCNSCHKRVINLDGMNQEEVEALLEQWPYSCVYVPPSSANIKTTGYKHGLKDDPCPFRRINTVRGEKEINQGVHEGFWPLVRQVLRSPKISSWMAVYQNEETGEIKCVGDHRWPPKSPWKQIIQSFDYYPNVWKHEIAAYLIPSDLKIGERVFLTDLIEDRVGVFGNQGHTRRLESAYAIWEGKDFKIQWTEEKDAPRMIG